MLFKVIGGSIYSLIYVHGDCLRCIFSNLIWKNIKKFIVLLSKVIILSQRELNWDLDWSCDPGKVI